MFQEHPQNRILVPCKCFSQNFQQASSLSFLYGSPPRPQVSEAVYVNKPHEKYCCCHQPPSQISWPLPAKQHLILTVTDQGSHYVLSHQYP